jgi:hypothetical protein
VVDPPEGLLDNRPIEAELSAEELSGAEASEDEEE